MICEHYTGEECRNRIEIFKSGIKQNVCVHPGRHMLRESLSQVLCQVIHSIVPVLKLSTKFLPCKTQFGCMNRSSHKHYCLSPSPSGKASRSIYR